MGLRNDPTYAYDSGFKTMDLSIESLQGPPFDLKVSIYDTIGDVKARIYKKQGIPVTQQHLVWNSMELDDDSGLQDYDIQDGSTLKLVPMMRVGPINTRRIPIEEPSLRDYSDYFTEANREELCDKFSGSGRPLTVIVYQQGDKINLFRIVDREPTSPLSESLSNASVYGMYEEEEGEPEPSKEKCEENDKMHSKMTFLKSKMAEKKPKAKKVHLPHPPASARASGRASGRPRLQRLPSSASRHQLFNKNACLPPVGQSSAKASGRTQAAAGSASALSDSSQTDLLAESKALADLDSEPPSASSSASKEKPKAADPLNDVLTSLKPPLTCKSLPGSASKVRKPLDVHANDSAKLSRLTSVLEDEAISSTTRNNMNNAPASAAGRKDSVRSSGRPPSEAEAIENYFRSANMTSSARKTPRSKLNFSQELLLNDAGPTTASRPTTGAATGVLRKSLEPTATTSYTYKEPKSGRKSRGGLDRLLSDPSGDLYGTGAQSASSTHPLEVLKETLGHSPSSTSMKRSKGVILESLNPSEVAGISGMLNNFVNSASKSRNGYIKDGRIPTPESRLMSARIRMSAGRDGHVTPSAHRLPPVKAKKKPSKRCALCNKKTGLASSYACRCGSNFCATHRYAESHNCTFDYKTEGRKLLEQANPVVTAPKLPKI